MGQNIDKNGRLEEKPFDYQMTKAGKMMISYEGRQVMILNEKEATRLYKRIDGKSDMEVQLALAKATGNFKRGNEKVAKRLGGKR